MPLRKPTIASFAAMLLLGGVFALPFLAFSPFLEAFWWRCQFVAAGQTLESVQATLGPGEPFNFCPETRDGPVVTGPRFHKWASGHTELWVGVADGRLVSTWVNFQGL